MFETFVATRKINIGGKIGKTVELDEPVQYDETSFKFLKDGVEISYPEFRGAIRAGWFVKVDPEGRPASVDAALAESPKTVRAGMSGMVVESDERYVGKVAKPVEKEDTAVKRGPFNKTLQQSQDWEVVNNYKNRTPFNKDSQVVEEQGGVVVGRVSTPTNITITPQNMTSVRQALEAQGPVKIIDEHRAVGIEDMNQRALDHISKQSSGAQARTASVQAPQRPLQQTVETSQLTSDSLEPKPMRRQVVQEEDDKVVATLKKDAPIEWDKTVHWRVRAKELKEMGSKDRKRMERILTVEVPSVVKVVRDSFPLLEPV